MQYLPHYYVHIPPIEDPQHSNNLCSKKLYHITMFKFPLLNTHNIHIICVIKNRPQRYYVQMPPFKTHKIEKIHVALNCYQVLFTYQSTCWQNGEEKCSHNVIKGFHVGYCSTNENPKALQIREIIPSMQHVPHYYVQIVSIEDPQHWNNLCSQKLYHIIMFRYPHSTPTTLKKFMLL